MAAWGCVLRVGLKPGGRGEGVARVASGITSLQRSRLRREQAALGSGAARRVVAEKGRGTEGGDEGGTFIPCPLSPHRRRSLEILAIAGAAVLEALGLENAAGSGELPKGWGQRELTLGDPGAARKLEARAA